MNKDKIEEDYNVLDEKLASALEDQHEFERVVDDEVLKLYKENTLETKEDNALSGEKFEEPEPGSKEEKEWKK